MCSRLKPKISDRRQIIRPLHVSCNIRRRSGIVLLAVIRLDLLDILPVQICRNLIEDRQ